MSDSFDVGSTALSPAILNGFNALIGSDANQRRFDPSIDQALRLSARSAILSQPSANRFMVRRVSASFMCLASTRISSARFRQCLGSLMSLGCTNLIRRSKLDPTRAPITKSCLAGNCHPLKWGGWHEFLYALQRKIRLWTPICSPPIFSPFGFSTCGLPERETLAGVAC